MGGYGSSRWGTTVTRVSTEGLPRLDVRVLERMGCLRLGASAAVTWDSGTSITVEVLSHDPRFVTLQYLAQTGSGSPAVVRQLIRITTTPCTFGGTQVWFSCPGCCTRCAVLYGLKGWFRCRGCHRLAYASTREDR
jgi:hypothetical protein